jgi:hypothetical protein
MMNDSETLDQSRLEFENLFFENNEIIDKTFKPRYKNILILSIFHICAIYGIYLCAKAQYQTIIFGKLNIKIKQDLT